MKILLSERDDEISRRSSITLTWGSSLGVNEVEMDGNVCRNRGGVREEAFSIRTGNCPALCGEVDLLSLSEA
ncbi:hypothetical protein [Sorangium sp. So ce341]|uniref:hypothetical protein n=1 Tax=Sorangium sp. So ce341 TaxID=3133302 RepID=UPI003F5E8AE5